MKESDWKIFVKIKKMALDKYCSIILEESQALINDEKISSHERYINLFQLIQKRDKTIARIFNGHSRSNAWLQLMGMRQEGIADKALLTQLSEDFQKVTNPNKHIG